MFEPKKATKSFVMILALMTVLSLVVSGLHSFGVIDLTKFLGGALATLLGLGLVMEAGGLTTFAMLKGGVQGKEIVHLLTLVVGLFVLVGGIAQLVGFAVSGTAIGGIIGVANMVSAVFVVIQAFIV